VSSEQEEKQRPQPIQGLSSAGGRFAIVASRFNTLIVDRLLEGALEAFSRCGTPADRVGVLRVPGAFELPLAASRLAASENYDALVALGCVVRGETPHFDHVSRAATDGLERVSLDFGIPIGFGVLTTEDMAQARARSGGESGDMGSNRGFDAALAAIQMFQLLREV
jgi:6,7-dimethyl-8-ribityllumazine synthase